MSVGDLSPLILQQFRNKVLPHEEVRTLIWRSQRGDKKATDILVRHNMKLVYLVAKRYTRAVELQDLVQEGVLGLLKAIADFDLSTNNKLSTYAKWWVVAFVKRAAQRCTGMTALNPARDRHKVPIKEKHFVPLDGTIAVEDENPLPDELIHREQLRAQIRNVVVMEAKDQREVVVARRIADRKDKDFELGRLGERFGVSRERIRQVELNIKKRLARSGKLRKLAGVR